MEDEVCSICQEKMQYGFISQLNCEKNLIGENTGGHWFHFDCIRKWFATASTDNMSYHMDNREYVYSRYRYKKCPICRQGSKILITVYLGQNTALPASMKIKNRKKTGHGLNKRVIRNNCIIS